MGIMTRMLRLCKADVHGVMDQLEDKGLLLKQYLREMETCLDHKEREVRSLTRDIDRMAAQSARHRHEMEKLEQDLTLALQKEKDDIARLLIRRRRALESAALHLDGQVASMTQEKAHLAETLSNQRLHHEALKAKADAYCRREADRLMADTGASTIDDWIAREPNDEEMELELLQRKESLQKGGAA